MKLVGSVVVASNAMVDTSGGAGSVTGGKGRLIFGSNAGGPPNSVTNATLETFAGPRRSNPFILGQPQTPYIPDLVGGAEAFGLLNSITADAPDFDSVRNAAPEGTMLAVLRLDTGPTNYSDSYEGFDMVLLINLSNAPVANPWLGIDESGTSSVFMTNLLVGGYSNDPQFGGGGYQPVSQLGAGEVYVTLVPDGTASFNVVANGRILSGVSLTNGSVAYLTSDTPTIGPLAFVGATNQVLEATSPAGAVAVFGVTATNSFQPNVPVTCTPPSGSTFALGTNTVTCVAVDAFGATNTATFIVTVLLPAPPVFAGYAVPAPGQFWLRCQGKAGLTYTLQSSTNLMDWVDRTNLIADPDGWIEWQDDTQTNASTCFYRLKWP